MLWAKAFWNSSPCRPDRRTRTRKGITWQFHIITRCTVGRALRRSKSNRLDCRGGAAITHPPTVLRAGVRSSEPAGAVPRSERWLCNASDHPSHIWWLGSATDLRDMRRRCPVRGTSRATGGVRTTYGPQTWYDVLVMLCHKYVEYVVGSR